MSREGFRTPAEEHRDRTDHAVLTTLVNEQPQPSSMEELEPSMGDRIDVDDSVARLYRAGLVHRLEGFVFGSRAAQRAVALSESV